MTALRPSALLLLLGTACSLFGKSSDTAEPQPPAPVIEQGSKDTLRAGEAAMMANIAQMDEQIDATEAKLRTALEAALGQAGPVAGSPVPAPASQTVADLKKAKITLQIEPVLDHTGKPLPSGLVELKDSNTDKMVELSRKMGSGGKLSKKQQKWMQTAAQKMTPINDLKAQVRVAVDPAMNSGWMITTGSTTTMQVVAGMVRSRRQMEMEWLDEDYAIVQQLLASQSRREAVGAVSIGLMASYQLAFAEGGDPTIVDTVAQASLDALPMKGEASLDDAKAYVENFDANVESAQVQYDAQMRKTFGDEVYEAKYKAGIDATFTQIAGASSAQSVTEMMAENNATYEEHLKMCARGEAPPPSTMVGPGKCKEAKAAAGSGGELSPDVLAGLLGGAGAVDGKAIAKKGILLALEKIPGGKQVQRALEGVKALRDGDPSIALRLAADLVPLPGPAKMALSGAATIAEGLPKAKRSAKRMRG